MYVYNRLVYSLRVLFSFFLLVLLRYLLSFAYTASGCCNHEKINNILRSKCNAYNCKNISGDVFVAVVKGRNYEGIGLDLD